MENRKVIIGLSGGVDSAVAAYLLKRDEYDVIGVTLRTWQSDEGQESRCCEIDDAREVARTIGIPYYVFNCTSDFDCKVIKPFIDDYINGMTPNPCVICNREIKWERLLYYAKLLEADYVATGHYASVVKLYNGRYTVKKAEHAEKDQTYMLYRLTQEQLRHTLMPLGKLTKEEVRKLAGAAGLPVAGKKDSQEICFVTEGTHADFIERYSDAAPPPEGDFTDENGNVLGRHAGIHHYTVGQRRGLGVSCGAPVYVRSIDARNNRIILGEERSLYTDTVIISRPAFMGIAGMQPGDRLHGYAKIRYHHAPQAAEASYLSPDRIALHFASPVRAAAPGQSAVLYDADGCILLGGEIAAHI